MKLETIYEHWSSDSKIDRTELASESIKIPQLHAKYFKFYSEERLRLKQYESEYKMNMKVNMK